MGEGGREGGREGGKEGPGTYEEGGRLVPLLAGLSRLLLLQPRLHSCRLAEEAILRKEGGGEREGRREGGRGGKLSSARGKGWEEEGKEEEREGGKEGGREGRREVPSLPQ